MKVTSYQINRGRKQMSNEVRSVEVATAQYPASHRPYHFIQKDDPQVPYHGYKAAKDRLVGDIPPPLFTKGGSLTDAAKARSKKDA